MKPQAAAQSGGALPRLSEHSSAMFTGAEAQSVVASETLLRRFATTVDGVRGDLAAFQASVAEQQALQAEDFQGRLQELQAESAAMKEAQEQKEAEAAAAAAAAKTEEEAEQEAAAGTGAASAVAVAEEKLREAVREAKEEARADTKSLQEALTRGLEVATQQAEEAKAKAAAAEAAAAAAVEQRQREHEVLQEDAARHLQALEEARQQVADVRAEVKTEVGCCIDHSSRRFSF